MKKTIVIVMVLVMLVTMSASAELQFTAVRTEHKQLGTLHTGEVVWDDFYYGTVKSETGSTSEIEISKAEYDKAFKTLNPPKKNFFQKVGGWLSFWNPND